MDLLAKSANKIYEQVIRLRNIKADTKRREELQQKLELDFLKKRGSNELVKSVIRGKETIPVRCSILEKQALKEILRLPYAEMFLSPDLLEKINKVTEMVSDEWTMGDIEIVNKGKENRSLYEDGRIKVKSIFDAIMQRKQIMITSPKFQTKCYPILLEYNEQLNTFQLIYVSRSRKQIEEKNDFWAYSLIKIDEIENITVIEEEECLGEGCFKNVQECIFRGMESCENIFTIKGTENAMQLLRRFSHYKREVEYLGDDLFVLTVRYGLWIGMKEMLSDAMMIKDEIEFLDENERRSGGMAYASIMNQALKGYSAYAAMRNKK